MDHRPSCFRYRQEHAGRNSDCDFKILFDLFMFGFDIQMFWLLDDEVKENMAFAFVATEQLGDKKGIWTSMKHWI
ncbi:hypothetical protein Csa_002509 [Cucumis sativus]|uniref:Uncharacterized protein n=1 Tax=Cucumis sativus TaxID=3659 RepID=A0A0A0LHM4_CUCSA|nr:hypothetical protein Csa_002509 [Cucumis sativus]